MNKILDEKKLKSEFVNDYLIYTRKSTDDAENQKNSIEYQISENLRFAKKDNLQVAQYSIEGFCENGIIQEKHSGFKEDEFFNVHSDRSISQLIDRPKFLNLVRVLLNKEFKGVICLCWDRISRNETDDVVIKKLLKQGVDVRFAQVTYDKSSSGDLHMDIDGVFSRHYSRVISEKVRNASVKLRKEGRCIYSAPIGYLDQGSDSKPFDPERAPIVKRLFELYATGKWSLSSMVRWASKQGLTTKPIRRKRTNEEKLNGLEVDVIPKISRTVTKSTIENILKNPFYIGKNVFGTELIDSTAHQPLIDTKLFYKVQALLKSKTTFKQYEEHCYFAYRDLIICDICRRKFTPYEQKGITYYKSSCKLDCTNTKRNMSEKYINIQIQKVLGKIAFSDKELMEIEIKAKVELNKVTERRNAVLEDLYRQYNKALADLDYLSKEKITLLRSQTLSIEQIRTEEARLNLIIEDLQEKIKANAESSQTMLNYIITFSELVKYTPNYFDRILDSEKRDLLSKIFHELSFENGKLKYQANEAFEDFLRRFNDPFGQSGWADYLFRELPTVFSRVKLSMQKLKVIKLPNSRV